VRRTRDVVVGDENRVAIGRALRRRLDADHAAGAELVLEVELLADGARLYSLVSRADKIQPAAGPPGYDEAHRPHRVIKRRAETRQNPGGGGGASEPKDLAATKRHGRYPD